MMRRLIPISNPTLRANSPRVGGIGVAVNVGVEVLVGIEVAIADGVTVDVCVAVAGSVAVCVGADVDVGVGVGLMPQADNVKPREVAPVNLRKSRRDNCRVILESPYFWNYLSCGETTHWS